MELYQAFQTSPDVRIKLFLGDEERVDYDLNRASSKHSNFYNRLLLFMTQINLKQFQKEKGFSPNQFLPCTDDLKVNSRLREQTINLYQENVNKVLLLDIHSFPFSLSGNEYGPFEVVFLVLPDDSLSIFYAYYLLSQLLKVNILSTIFVASEDNEIIFQAHHHGFVALLIEFNEKLTAPRRKFIHSQLVQHLQFLLQGWIFPLSSPIRSILDQYQMTEIVSPILGQIEHVSVIQNVFQIILLSLPLGSTKSSLQLQVKGISSDTLSVIVHSGQCVFRGQTLARGLMKNIHLSWKNLFVSPVSKKENSIRFAIKKN